MRKTQPDFTFLQGFLTTHHPKKKKKVKKKKFFATHQYLPAKKSDRSKKIFNRIINQLIRIFTY
jgi:hypothetical protein